MAKTNKDVVLYSDIRHEAAGQPSGYGDNPGSQFNDQARSAIDQYTMSMGSVRGSENGEGKLSTEDLTKRERAKRANKIYRKACNDAGLDSCFFRNFVTWSDYVGGKISESEFHQRTLHTAKEMAAGMKGS